MAPVGEAFFPPLDRCFSGECQLLSWQATYATLLQGDERINEGALKRFLTDPQTTEYLVSVFSPFDVPNVQTKSTFETKTSAINVGSSPHAPYDITKIKEDALWLSKKTAIDEVAALRITVLEWQTRSSARLLEKEVLERQTNALQLSVQAGGASTLRKQVWQNNDSPEARDPMNERRIRLLEIFLSERCHLMKTSEYILSHYICVLDSQSRSGPAQGPDDTQRWLGGIGEEILSKWAMESSQKGKGKEKQKQKSFISLALNALGTKLQGISKGCSWLDPDEIPESLQLAWAHNLSLEMIHILQITLSILEVQKGVLPPEPVLPWFQFMHEVHFFEGFRLLGEDGQGLYELPLQSLAVLVSLACIDISSTLELLTQTSTSLMPAAELTDNLPYILNPRTIAKLHEIFIDLAPLRVASPVILAWSIIAQTIREIALTARETRETRQSLRATDHYGGPDSSDTDGNERMTPRRGAALRRRSSTGSDTSLPALLVEEMYEATTVTDVDEDPISYLATSAVQNENVFDIMATVATDFCTLLGFEHAGRPGQRMRNKLLELISSSVDFIQYQPALIDSTLCILTGKERFWELLDRPVSASDNQPSAHFIRNPELRQKLLLVAASRFPYESVPFLEVCRALAFQYTSSDGSESIPWANLEEFDTFTCKMPPGFEATIPTREDEEGQYLILTETLNVLIGSQETDILCRAPQLQRMLPLPPPAAFVRHDLTMAEISIPVGTEGIVQSDGKSKVIGWNYQYPGLAFMGKILQRASATGSSVEASSVYISPIVVAEVIRLISTLLVSAMKSPWADGDPSSLAESAQSILRQASDGLDRNHDIISVIFQIFENELHNRQESTTGEPSLDVLVQCMHFANALLLLIPDRVWPFLGRSGLLRIDREESQLSCVISTEMVIGQYDFLLGCVRLFDALIDDTISHGILRNTPTKSVTRFGDAESLGSGVSQVTMQNVLLSFTRSMIDVLESAMGWRFVVSADRSEINQRLCSAFDKIVTYYYGIGDSSTLSGKMGDLFASAAKYTVDAFLSASNNDFIFKPLMEIYTTAMHSRTTTLPSLRDQYEVRQTVAALDLASTLLHINTSLNQSPSFLEEELFKATPILARVYVAQESYRLPVVNLLNALLSASAIGNRPPQSLLGHLGHDDSNSFLEVLSQLDSPVNDATLLSAIWKLFSAVVSKRQQWFAMYILTGVTPRESLRNKNESKTSPATREPILNIALNSLSGIDKQDSSKALAMLEFVATSADNWPWVFTAIHQHPEFLKAISEFAAQTEYLANGTTGRSSKPPPDYHRLQMVSYVAKILAMHTYFTQQNNDQKAARSLVPHLNYLIRHAISVPSYNNSLHSNLRANLEAKFPGCSLADFKRGSWREGTFGESFYYDVNLADKMFSFDAAWLGRRSHGFLEEFKRANLNLSLVEAQINLFHGWKYLLIELSGPLASDTKFQRIMASAVTDCLRANADDTMPEAVFDRIRMSRADLAFTLLQRLVEERSTDSDVKEILPVAWATLRSYSASLEAALSHKDPDYYRLLLRILYLAIQFHASAPLPTSSFLGNSLENDSSIAPSSLRSTKLLTTVLEILSDIIARGFRSLTALLHTSPDRVLTSDFSILTAILRSCLRVPHLDQSSAQLLTVFSDSQTAYCAATLLSWSDQLASSTSGDPILGELSVQFLVELSANSSLAESLAVDGVLGQVLSTNIIRVLQGQVFTPVEPRARMYTIWARGVVPLLLNLLNAIGPPIAAEVAAALNNFPKQLSHSSNAFANNAHGHSATEGYITLSMANEAHDLALIISILEAIREAGASAAILVGEIPEVKWDSAQIKEDVESYLQDRSSLRRTMVATNQKEEIWSRTKPSREGIGSENMLEEKIVDDLGQLLGILSGDAEG